MPSHQAASSSPIDNNRPPALSAVIEDSQESTCGCCSNVVTPESASRTPLGCPEAIASLLQREANYTPQSSKRTDYIGWDDYFLAAAALSAQRSKDPVNATGACLVDRSNRIIGTGYNGFPKSASDDLLPWTNESDNILHTKSPYEVHAEVNAVLNKCASDCVGARLYTREFPCAECAKILVQSGISEVVYCKEPEDSPSLRASRILFSFAGVKLRRYTPTISQLTLDFGAPEEPLEPIVARETVKDSVDPKHRDLLLREANYDPVVSTKRSNYLSWDDYFVGMAFLTAQRSKDPNTQVGACIVDANKRIVGLGYNGFPSGCEDDILPWARTGDPLHTKYPYVCHAEVNAVLNKCSADVSGAKMFVALFPCSECAKIIIQAGIKEVVYLSDRYHDTDSCRASRILFQLAGVKLRKHTPQSRTIAVDLAA